MLGVKACATTPDTIQYSNLHFQNNSKILIFQHINSGIRNLKIMATKAGDVCSRRRPMSRFHKQAGVAGRAHPALQWLRMGRRQLAASRSGIHSPSEAFGHKRPTENPMHCIFISDNRPGSWQLEHYKQSTEASFLKACLLPANN